MTSGGRHRRPLGSSNHGFPGETSSTFSWVWSKLLGEGPPRGVVTSDLPLTLPPLLSLPLLTHLFYSLFLSLVPFFCPFPPTPSFPVVSLPPQPPSSGWLPYWHWKFPCSVSEAGRTDGRWSLECASSLFWRSPSFGCEEGESKNGADPFSWPCVPSSALL